MNDTKKLIANHKQNPIGNEGAKAIGEALRANAALTELNIKIAK